MTSHVLTIPEGFSNPGSSHAQLPSLPSPLGYLISISQLDMTKAKNFDLLLGDLFLPPYPSSPQLLAPPSTQGLEPQIWVRHPQLSFTLYLHIQSISKSSWLHLQIGGTSKPRLCIHSPAQLQKPLCLTFLLLLPESHHIHGKGHLSNTKSGSLILLLS